MGKRGNGGTGHGCFSAATTALKYLSIAYGCYKDVLWDSHLILAGEHGDIIRIWLCLPEKIYFAHYCFVELVR